MVSMYLGRLCKAMAYLIVAPFHVPPCFGRCGSTYRPPRLLWGCAPSTWIDRELATCRNVTPSSRQQTHQNNIDNHFRPSNPCIAFIKVASRRASEPFHVSVDPVTYPLIV